jgi:hypothetical protein
MILTGRIADGVREIGILSRRMSPDSSMEGADPADRDALVAELERRILELDDHDEPEFGGFNAIDWVILLLGAVIVPILLIIRFAP